MFPESGTQIKQNIKSESSGIKSFSFDFSLGDFVIQDGGLAPCDGIDAIKVWIEKILRTEKDRFKMYKDTNYGCKLEDLIVGGNYPTSFIESELKREIEDALLQNTQIKSISNFTITRNTSSITVGFTVQISNAGDEFKYNMNL